MLSLGESDIAASSLTRLAPRDLGVFPLSPPPFFLAAALGLLIGRALIGITCKKISKACFEHEEHGVAKQERAMIYWYQYRGVFEIAAAYTNLSISFFLRTDLCEIFSAQLCGEAKEAMSDLVAVLVLSLSVVVDRIDGGKGMHNFSKYLQRVRSISNFQEDKLEKWTRTWRGATGMKTGKRNGHKNIVRRNKHRMKRKSVRMKLEIHHSICRL